MKQLGHRMVAFVTRQVDPPPTVYEKEHILIDWELITSNASYIVKVW